MNEFNLKKRNARRKAYFDKINLLAKNGSDLISDKLKFISKKIENQVEFQPYMFVILTLKIL